MKIKLSNGNYALIDDEDYGLVANFRWHQSGNRALAHQDNHTIYLHRLLMRASKGAIIDHINGDGLDNRKVNLRFCSHRQNLRNRGKTVKSTSGYKGVYWDKEKNRWLAQIMVDYKSKFLGYYDDRLSAREAYIEAATEYHKEFAHE